MFISGFAKRRIGGTNRCFHICKTTKYVLARRIFALKSRRMTVIGKNWSRFAILEWTAWDIRLVKRGVVTWWSTHAVLFLMSRAAIARYSALQSHSDLASSPKTWANFISNLVYHKRTFLSASWPIADTWLGDGWQFGISITSKVWCGQEDRCEALTIKERKVGGTRAAKILKVRTIWSPIQVKVTKKRPVLRECCRDQNGGGACTPSTPKTEAKAPDTSRTPPQS